MGINWDFVRNKAAMLPLSSVGRWLWLSGPVVVCSAVSEAGRNLASSEPAQAAQFSWLDGLTLR